MTVEKIHTEKAPAAVGPYSQAIVTGASCKLLTGS